MKSPTSLLPKAIVVLTVLSGSVAVQVGAEEQVVNEGKRATVDAGKQSMISGDISQTEYLRQWVAGRVKQAKAPPELLTFVALRPNLLYSLMAVNVESGQARRIADFVSGGPQVVKQFGPNLALVDAGSVIHGRTPLAGGGNPLIDSPLDLVDLQRGEKLPMTPLKKFWPDYIELSPDRRRIAFLGNDQGECGLWLMDLETFKPSLLLQRDVKTVPAWSPDSRWVAISKGEGYGPNGHEIVLIDTLRGEVRKTGWKGAGAEFSPDGKHLVYSGGFCFKSGGASYYQGIPLEGGDLWMAALPQGQPAQITRLAEGSAVVPRFSPDGSLLAYMQMALTEGARLPPARPGSQDKAGPDCLRQCRNPPYPGTPLVGRQCENPACLHDPEGRPGRPAAAGAINPAAGSGLGGLAAENRAASGRQKCGP